MALAEHSGPELPAAAVDWARTEVTVRSYAAVRSRPWAAVGRVQTEDRLWWLKVNFAATTYEPRLLAFLADLGSDLVPPCRTHPTEPWSLIADAGRSAREVLADRGRDEQVEFWCDLLPRYAELQQTAHRRPWPGLSLPDFTPDRLLSDFDALVADARWFTSEVAPELTAQQWKRVRGCRAGLAQAAERLAEGLPPTIQHDDLHDGNVLLDRGVARIIDWGDAVLAHPFGTLLVTLNALADRWQVADDDPVIGRVQDAYLEPWLTGGESLAELRRQADLARRTGGLARAAGWVRALGDPATGLALGFADAPSAWLGELADALDSLG